MLFDSLPFPAIAGMEEELRTEFAMSGSAAPARNGSLARIGWSSRARGG
jgi:hypothetical protein